VFGFYRTLLAILVVTTHLYGLFYYGIYAVFGFYLLSGYLMTTVMHKTYTYTFTGMWRYVTNRFLRIYPPYWAAIAFTLVLLFIFGEDMLYGYQKMLFFPRTGEEILRNVFLIFDKETSSPRLSPATWALTVELSFYLLICLGVSKTKRRTILWVIASLFYTGYVLIFLRQRLTYYTYSSILAGSLPFALGSYLYFLIQEKKFSKIFLSHSFLRPEFFTILMLFNMNIFTVFYRINSPYKKFGFTYGFYINLAIAFILTLSLIYYKGYAGTTKRLDKIIGDLSYPIYLLHWQVGFLTSILVVGRPFHGFTEKGLYNLLVAIPVLIFISFLFAKLIDEPINRIRTRLKSTLSEDRKLRHIT
jgi:peptidoglycan/LPS O-acetylase OafA/YrhL